MEEQTLQPEARLYVATSVDRGQSIGTVIRCSCAFGATEVFIIGCPTYSTYGAHGAQCHMQVRHFCYWQDFRTYVKEKLGAKLIGILPRCDVDYPNKKSLYNLKFDGPTCFVMCGRDEFQVDAADICDEVVYLNVPVRSRDHFIHIDAKLSICLHLYASGMNMKQTSFGGGKHDLNGEKPKFKKVIIDEKMLAEPEMEEQDFSDSLESIFSW